MSTIAEEILKELKRANDFKALELKIKLYEMECADDLTVKEKLECFDADIELILLRDD